MTRAAKLCFVPVLLLMAAFFFYVSQHRLIDDDEGFYLLASRLVLQHRAPYLDFFYTQAPLLPYVYAVWLKLAGISWMSARAFCALLSTAVGALLYWHVSRETGKALAGSCAALLFAISSLVFAWYPIVKTFALAMLFLFPAYMIFARLGPGTRTWLIGAAGVLLGLSVDTRSYVVGVLPVFLWWLLRRREYPGCPTQARRWLEWEKLGPSLLWFLGGFVVGIVPSLILFVASPSAFMFNNLGYHALRSGGEGLVGMWTDKMWVAGGLMGGRYTGFQFLSTLAVALLLRARRDSVLLALWLGGVMAVVSLMPTPASIQYFALVLPFFTVAAVCSVSDYLARPNSPDRLQLVRGLSALLVVVYVGFAVPVVEQYLFTGKKVPGLRDMTDTPNWTLGHVTAVSRAIDEVATPGEDVASFWPGYIFASSAEPLPGMENNFGMWVAGSLTPDKRREYHILTAQEVVADLARHKARFAVVGNQGPWNGAPEYDRAVSQLRILGYTPIRNVGESVIFEYKGAR